MEARPDIPAKYLGLRTGTVSQSLRVELPPATEAFRLLNSKRKLWARGRALEKSSLPLLLPLTKGRGRASAERFFSGPGSKATSSYVSAHEFCVGKSVGTTHEKAFQRPL